MTPEAVADLVYLRAGASVSDACRAVGYTSLGSFSTRFAEIVGQAPTAYAALDHHDLDTLPPRVRTMGLRPRRVG